VQKGKEEEEKGGGEPGVGVEPFHKKKKTGEILGGLRRGDLGGNKENNRKKGKEEGGKKVQRLHKFGTKRNFTTVKEKCPASCTLKRSQLKQEEKG